MKASLDAQGMALLYELTDPIELQGVPLVRTKGFTAPSPDSPTGPAQAPGI